MDEDIWILDICEVGKGWLPSQIFKESERPQMLLLIKKERSKLNTVITQLIHAKSVESLRQFFKQEIKL